jgi:hypothetical protein
VAWVFAPPPPPPPPHTHTGGGATYSKVASLCSVFFLELFALLCLASKKTVSRELLDVVWRRSHGCRIGKRMLVRPDVVYGCVRVTPFNLGTDECYVQ